MRKVIAAGLFMLGLAIGVSAQTTYTVVAQPFLCINQTSFFCYNTPVTVNGTPGTMTIDLFAGETYGYISVQAGVWDYFNNLTVVKGPLDAQGHFSTLQIADKSGDLLLNLSVTWKAYSSGGGRGSHNVIWRPIISTDPAQASYFTTSGQQTITQD